MKKLCKAYRKFGVVGKLWASQPGGSA